MVHAVPLPDKEHFVNKIERITWVLRPQALEMVLLASQTCFHDVRSLVNYVSISFGLYRSMNSLSNALLNIYWLTCHGHLMH